VAARRATSLATLTDGVFDVLIIGGGINGAGIARDAALRGLRVALIEQDDFGSGTSSRSSRLVHGGLRYLEHGHIHLVFESSRERSTLLRIAPHLVRPLAFTWPVYRGARVSRWKLAAGLMVYDALALFRDVASHRRYSRDGILALEPALDPRDLLGGAQYHDAGTDDTRLTLENVLDAEAAGAVVVNHARVSALAVQPGASRVTIDDVRGGERLDVRARVVINAGGPWSDGVRRLADANAPAGLRGTKGVHIAVAHGRVGNRAALTLLSPVDGRVMFVLPAGSRTIIGTTDTPTTMAPDNVRATSADVDYLLRSVNRYFPGANLVARDVVAAWAGIRPLVAASYGADAGSASREHKLEWGPDGMLTVSGGKLTTYRVVARQVADAAERVLRRGRVSRSTTGERALPGGDITSVDAAVAEAAHVTGDLACARHLVTNYGSRWRAITAQEQQEPSQAVPIVPGLPYRLSEIACAIATEHAMTLADLLVRRTHIAYETPDHGVAAAGRILPVAATALGWDATVAAHARDAYAAEAARLFGIETAER
jgi:glycerol-3-phosphate dehydrogenase